MYIIYFTSFSLNNTHTLNMIGKQEEEILIKLCPENIEFSYETICHTKISPNDYEFCFAIPQSKKYIGYIISLQNEPIFVLFELNRFKKISNVVSVATIKPSFKEIVGWLSGTLIYGSIVDNFFIIEDILMHKNIHLRKTPFKEKIFKMVQIISISHSFMFSSYSPFVCKLILPHALKTQEDMYSIKTNDIPYSIHHLQFHSLEQLKPILNVLISKSGTLDIGQNNQYQKPLFEKNTPTKKCNFSKPQYKKRTVFEVMADYPFDIYKLFAFNNSKNGGDKHVFVDVMYIPDYETSKFMNSIFRKIKENENLDYIEESDDEEEFENTNIDKYVDVVKKVNIECYFHFKFKRWIPISVVNYSVNGGKIVPISNL